MKPTTVYREFQEAQSAASELNMSVFAGADQFGTYWIVV